MLPAQFNFNDPKQARKFFRTVLIDGERVRGVQTLVYRGKHKGELRLEDYKKFNDYDVCEFASQFFQIWKEEDGRMTFTKEKK